jgi:hypothetical protein
VTLAQELVFEMIHRIHLPHATACDSTTWWSRDAGVNPYA